MTAGVRAASLALAGFLTVRAQSVDQVLKSYIDAVGGQAAIDRIHTRRADVSSRFIGHDTIFWAAPDKVLRTGRNGKAGFDGATGWEETKKKKVQKLPHSRADELETDANPIRFVRLRDMYHDLQMDKPATVDGILMDVVSAPNSIAATRFFFDHGSHLLVRIEELGVTSAYYKHTQTFESYKAVDGVRLPTQILRTSDEPDSEKGELHLTDIKQNVPLDSAMFRKPDIGPVVKAGKH